MNIQLERLATAGFSLISAALIAVGCASGPPRELTNQLARADTSIAQAEQAGATQGGLAELQQAKDKRAQAQEAMSDRKYDLSMQLAQQAQLDAQYAGTKARANQAELAATDADRGTETLRREAVRNLDEASRRE